MNADPFVTGALATLVLLACGFLVTAVVLRGPEDSFPIALFRALCWIYCRVVHRLRIEIPGRDSLPAEGGCIVVSNHRSGLDPVVLSMTTQRRIRFLMAREYYAIPILRGLFRVLRAIPVNRDGNDLAAMKVAIRGLKDGDVIGIFPQGGIRVAGPVTDGKNGIALLALRTGVPVVPMYVDGSRNTPSMARAFLIPSRTVVRAASPLVFQTVAARKVEREELEQVTRQVLEGISALAPVSAGKPL
jgi:1-acyl-sn-glycerol-3-phosphate acyltransferase